MKIKKIINFIYLLSTYLYIHLLFIYLFIYLLINLFISLTYVT